MTFPLTAYIEAALEMAHYDKLEDGSFAGEIPKLKGVIAFGKSLRECENELRSTLEDWILVGLRLGHKLPVVSGIDFNKVKHGRLAHRLSVASLFAGFASWAFTVGIPGHATNSWYSLRTGRPSPPTRNIQCGKSECSYGKVETIVRRRIGLEEWKKL
jgi:predicted RNase H-like HicB family nuclease